MNKVMRLFEHLTFDQSNIKLAIESANQLNEQPVNQSIGRSIEQFTSQLFICSPSQSSSQPANYFT